MRVKVDELFVEIGGGPDIDAKSFHETLVHLGIVVSDNERVDVRTTDSTVAFGSRRVRRHDGSAGALGGVRRGRCTSILLPEMSSILS